VLIVLLKVMKILREYSRSVIFVVNFAHFRVKVKATIITLKNNLKLSYCDVSNCNICLILGVTMSTPSSGNPDVKPNPGSGENELCTLHIAGLETNMSYSLWLIKIMADTLTYLPISPNLHIRTDWLFRNQKNTVKLL
jgi:hypothetical protein